MKRLLHREMALKEWRCFITGSLLVCLLVSKPIYAVTLPQKDATLLQDIKAKQQRGEHVPAIERLEELARKYPKESELTHLLAYSYFELKQYGKARQWILETLKRGHFSKAVFQRLVHINQRLGDDVATLNALRLLLITAPEEPAWQQAYGDLLTNLNQNREALLVYQRLVDQHPANGLYWKRLGRSQMQLDQMQQAILSYTMAWELGRKDMLLALTISNLYQHLGHFELAIDWHMKSSGLQNKHESEELLRLAKLHFKGGDKEKAEEILTSFLKAKNNKRDTYFTQGLIMLLEIQRDTDRAKKKQDYLKLLLTLEDVPANVKSKTLRTLGYWAFNRKNYTEAIDYLSQYKLSMPRDQSAWVLLIMAHIETDNKRTAIKLLGEMIARFGMHEDTELLMEKMFAL